MVQAEDQRFFQHSGVDWLSFLSAGWRNLSSTELRGASTITMQLTALIRPELGPRRGRRSILEKFRQVRAARKIESAWTKQQILEAYLNLATFRGELQGITAASQGLFHKEPHGVGANEAVVLAALLRAPNADLPASHCSSADSGQDARVGGRTRPRRSVHVPRVPSAGCTMSLRPLTSLLMSRGSCSCHP